MQVKIELPDELGKQLLEMPDMQLLVQKAVEKILLEEQQKHSSTPLTVKSSQLLVDLVNDLPELPTFKNHDLLKLPSNDEILPITRSLVGILKGSHVDIDNYSNPI